MGTIAALLAPASLAAIRAEDADLADLLAAYSAAVGVEDFAQVPPNGDTTDAELDTLLRATAAFEAASAVLVGRWTTVLAAHDMMEAA